MHLIHLIRKSRIISDFGAELTKSRHKIKENWGFLSTQKHQIPVQEQNFPPKNEMNGFIPPKSAWNLIVSQNLIVKKMKSEINFIIKIWKWKWRFEAPSGCAQQRGSNFPVFTANFPLKKHSELKFSYL